MPHTHGFLHYLAHDFDRALEVKLTPLSLWSKSPTSRIVRVPHV